MTYIPPSGDATSSNKGVLQLSGDLGGTADTPTVPGLASKADASAVYTTTQADSTFIPASQKGTASGVASLDSSGKVPSSQLPAAATGTNTGDQTLNLTGSTLSISGANGNSVSLPTASDDIKNQTASAQTASYWIDGSARVEDQTVLGGKTNQAQVVIRANSGQTAGNPHVVLQDGNGTEAARLTAYTGNLFLGSRAGRETSGTHNVGIGLDSLIANTTGGYNTAVGSASLSNTTTGSYNVGLGRSALQNNITGDSNVAIGYQSLVSSTTGYSNIGIGHQSLYSNSDGISNVALGTSALASNVSGGNNIAIGTYAQQANTTGSDNTALGRDALRSNTTGNYNLALGSQAGRVDSDGFTTGSTVEHASAIGSFAQVQANNSMVLGSIGADGNTKVAIGTTVPQNTLSVSPLNYDTGTVGVESAGPVVIGTGTTWTTAIVGCQFVFANGQSSIIASVTDATHLTLQDTMPITTLQKYRVHNPGLQVKSNGQVAIGTLQPSAGAALDVQGTLNTTNLTLNGQPYTSFEWVAPPASSSAAGTIGQKAYDANYLYICTATNTWARVTLTQAW